jgi:diguanylate cyclase (GGDEF)-like protein
LLSVDGFVSEFTSRVADSLLGPAGPQRWRVLQGLAAFGAHLALIAVLVLGRHWEAVGPRTAALWPLALFALGAGGGFVVLFRSGLNQRLAPLLDGDPTLALPQTLVGLVAVAWGYALAGPVRGALLGALVLVLVLAMFRLTPRAALVLGAVALALLWGVMRGLTLADPLRHPPEVERLNLLITALVLAGVSGPAMWLAHLYTRLRRQHAELRRAMVRISELATRDELTGLPNRRAMAERLAAETARQARLRAPLALVLIDLDHFKRINDAHGHAAGDAVLRGFAQRVEAELRGVDVMARWGGEEFLLMLPGNDVPHAIQAVERLRTQPFDEVAPGLVVTFSAGLTACLGQGDIDPAIERADQAMYRAKQAGRDRTTIG